MEKHEPQDEIVSDTLRLWPVPEGKYDLPFHVSTQKMEDTNIQHTCIARKAR
jgi:hypothetical protein